MRPLTITNPHKQNRRLRTPRKQESRERLYCSEDLSVRHTLFNNNISIFIIILIVIVLEFRGNDKFVRTFHVRKTCQCGTHPFQRKKSGLFLFVLLFLLLFSFLFLFLFLMIFCSYFFSYPNDVSHSYLFSYSYFFSHSYCYSYYFSYLRLFSFL